VTSFVLAGKRFSHNCLMRWDFLMKCFYLIFYCFSLPSYSSQSWKSWSVLEYQCWTCLWWLHLCSYHSSSRGCKLPRIDSLLAY
jgi:hypothetical protein